MVSTTGLPVLIVGAGPTGLMLALWLAKLHTPFRIVDHASGPGQASRAPVVQPRMLEHFRQLGIADDFIAAGRVVTGMTIRNNGRLSGELQMARASTSITRFPFQIAITQDETERIILKHVEAAGACVEWETELAQLEHGRDSARAVLRRADGAEESMDASYVVGCDGAHSAVRHLSDIHMPGGTYTQRPYVADVEATGDALENAQFGLCTSGLDMTLLVPLKKPGHVRLAGFLTHVASEDMTFEDVRVDAERATGLTVTAVHSFALYKIHHRVADRFHVGRAFLCGDAGHLHTPAGGQGMNTGLGDATNLAWKLAAVLDGTAPERLLDSYEPERRTFAQGLVRTTDELFSVETRQDWLGLFLRNFLMPYVLPLLMMLPVFARTVFQMVGQLHLEYRGSALSQGAVGAVRAGDRMPWVRFVDGSDNFEQHGTQGWQLHVYGRVPGALQTVEKPAWTLREWPWCPEAKDAGLTKDAIYLVRPDGYVGLATQDPMDVPAYLAAITKA